MSAALTTVLQALGSVLSAAGAALALYGLLLAALLTFTAVTGIDPS